MGTTPVPGFHYPLRLGRVGIDLVLTTDSQFVDPGYSRPLGNDEELKMHVRAAVTNGVSVEEIKEVFMHAVTLQRTSLRQ